MPIAFSNRIAPASSVMFRQVGEESVLLSLKTSKYLGLDPVGTRMWLLLTTSDSVQDAYAALLSEYDVEEAQLRTDLEEFLNKLLKHDLIEVAAADSASATQSS